MEKQIDYVQNIIIKRKCKLCGKKKRCRKVKTFQEKVSVVHGGLCFSCNWLCFDCENSQKRFTVFDTCGCKDCEEYDNFNK
jgi:hypothetical protein